MRLFALLVTLAALFWASTASAHGTRSVTVDVSEISPGKGVIRVRTTRPEDAAGASFDAPCTATPGEEGGGAVTLVTCPDGLAGRRLVVSGLGPVVSEAIVVATLSTGERVSKVLTGDEPSLVLPLAQTRASLAKAYVGFGVTHILTGYDHLLFLLALVLLLKSPRAILLSETAFTVSHSLSFSATALGLVHVATPAAEAAIALSLVLVALDIGREGEASSASRGASLAFVFGLVHGLGFAGGLAEIGLPDRDVAYALVGFAGGVELGQVAFLAVLVGALALARTETFQSKILVVSRIHPWLARVTFDGAAALLIGAVASSWLIERMSVCLSGG